MQHVINEVWSCVTDRQACTLYGESRSLRLLIGVILNDLE